MAITAPGTDPAANSAAAGQRRQHSQRKIAPPTANRTMGVGENSPFHMATPHLGSRAKTYPQPTANPGSPQPAAPLTGRRPPCPGLTTPHCAGPGRIVEAGLWIFTRTRIAGSTHEDVGLIITADLILFSSSSFCVIKAIFCDGFQTFCTPFVFALYICTLHVTGVGDEMRRPSSIHAWAVEGEGSIASWHHCVLIPPAKAGIYSINVAHHRSHSAGFSCCVPHHSYCRSLKTTHSRHNPRCRSICIGYTY